MLSVQWTVWSYALLLLAGYRTWGLWGAPLPLPAGGQALNAGLSTPSGALTALHSGANPEFRALLDSIPHQLVEKRSLVDRS